MRIGLGLLAIAIVCLAPSIAQATEVDCPHRAGFIDGPYVATADTARAIATTLVQQHSERQELYDLNVQDRGDHWVAFQSVRGYPRQEGDSIVVMRGGGELEMRIAKCDGAISDVHWAR